MTDVVAFKVVVVAAFVVAAARATTTARRAAARHGRSITEMPHEVRGVLVSRGALGLVFYAALVVWLFNLPGERSMDLGVPPALRWVGAVLLAAAVLGLVVSYQALGTNYRGGIGLYADHDLVTDGPYRLVRHPIYLSFIAIMVALTLVSSNWVLGLSGLVLVVLIALARIPVEERELHERFGDRWRAYRDRTRTE